MKEEKIFGFSKWQVEDALRTLTEAKEIHKNEKLMNAVKKLAEERLIALASVAGSEQKGNKP